MANIKQQSLVYFYSIAQALALTVAVISVSISAIVGKALAPSASLATLPYGLQFSAIIFASYTASLLMKKFGRSPIFLTGALVLGIGGFIGFLSIKEQSFLLNNLSHFCLGVSLSCFAFFRFAATDGLENQDKARAVSLVTLGGVVSALIGPQIAKHTKSLMNVEFMATYITLIIIALLLLVLISVIQKISKNLTTSESTEKVGQSSHVKTPKKLLITAVYASGFGYMLMGMLMMQSSLKLDLINISYEDIIFVIQMHVLAMFLPSLFMGKVISKYGVEKVIVGGYFVMFMSMLIAIFFQFYLGILTALIGIGLGWNMLYVGGSSLVAMLPGEAHKLQGTNESFVAIMNTIGAFSAGALFIAIGWGNSNWLAMSLLMPGLFMLFVSWKQIKELH